MNDMGFNGNWVDLVIIVVVIYFGSQSLRFGFWHLLSDFIAFLGSLIIAIRGYKFAAGLLKDNFNLTHSIANALGFLITAIVVESILGFIGSLVLSRIPQRLIKHKISKYLGLLPSVGEGLVISAFILTLVLSMPVQPWIKRDLSNSKIGGFLISQTSGVETRLNEIFGGAIEDSLNYFTIKSGSKERIALQSEAKELSSDPVAEKEMFFLVNEERKKVGVGALAWREEIVPVAKAHATDMWKRSYFSHYSPEDDDVGDRLNKAGIRYMIAGENLALAPTLKTAHTGLMNSEGHRANILEKKFKSIGIGVIDNGIYGKMFVQIFTD